MGNTAIVLAAAIACQPSLIDLVVISTPEAAIANAREAWESIYEKTGRFIYSEESTARFEPYTAALKNGVWIVQGTIPAGYHDETIETSVCQSNGSVSVSVE